MLHIDGSYGEGGGQILRNAVALSVLTKKPIEITNIRANRPNPGIRPQHHTAISCIKSMCNAETEGLTINSKKLKFNPRDIQPGKYSFDIGTAGSITLAFQACLLCSLKTTKPITIKLTGGTDVKWSPSWDYFTHIFLPLIQQMGIGIEAQLIKRGYYPKGGGEATVTIHPIEELKPLSLGEKQDFHEMEGIIHIAGLPSHISRRMKHTVLKLAVENNLKASIKTDQAVAYSAGTGITLWSKSNSAILGSTVIGERGVTSEKIGEEAAIQLINDIKTGASIDIYAIDQILPYMALTENESICMVRELSTHTKTTIWIIQKLFNNQQLFELKNKNNLTVVKVKGTKIL